MNLVHLYLLHLDLFGSCSVMSDSLRPHGLQPARLLRPWDSPGKYTGVGYHFLLHTFSSVQFSHSVVSESLRPQDCSTPGLPVHHQLPEFTQTHVH